MKEAHDTPLSIHPGSTKIYQYIRQRYWWSNMKQDIARYVEECDVCHLMSTHASILVDYVGPPSAEVCRTVAISLKWMT